jgi:hypothetical protein
VPQADMPTKRFCEFTTQKTTFKARVFVVRSANNRCSQCVRPTVLPVADHAGNRRADDGRQPE